MAEATLQELEGEVTGRRWSAGRIARVALLLAFGRNGFLGQYLDQWFGITIPFSPAAVVMAETFVAMPFLVVTVEGALRSADRGYEQAAATLGATRMVVFRRVTLPLVAPSLVAGAVLCWARALGEFGATIPFSGSFPGRPQATPTPVATHRALRVPRRGALPSLVPRPCPPAASWSTRRAVSSAPRAYTAAGCASTGWRRSTPSSSSTARG